MYHWTAFLIHRLWWRIASLLLVTAVGAHFALTPAQSPLEKYLALKPGVTETSLNGYSVIFSNYVFNPEMTEYYEILPQNDAVRMIRVTVSSGRISSVFIVSNTLNLADVVAIWGVPRHTRNYRSYQTLIWDCGLQVTLWRAGDLLPTPRSLFAPITYIMMPQNFACRDQHER